MATPKVITIADLKRRRIIFEIDSENNLQAQMVYQYADGSGNVIPGMDAQRVARSVPWASVPAQMRTALQAISDYLYNAALSDEGME